MGTMLEGTRGGGGGGELLKKKKNILWPKYSDMFFVLLKGIILYTSEAFIIFITINFTIVIRKHARIDGWKSRN